MIVDDCTRPDTEPHKMRRVELVSKETLEAIKNDPRITQVESMTPFDRLCGVELTTDLEYFMRANIEEFREQFIKSMFEPLPISSSFENDFRPIRFY